jgi:hypothetical protein
MSFLSSFSARWHGGTPIGCVPHASRHLARHAKARATSCHATLRDTARNTMGAELQKQRRPRRGFPEWANGTSVAFWGKSELQVACFQFSFSALAADA